uniref:Uncharacterized protein n=1 Tax=Romanomermis culicivorax TaxID=13658 RepID=A0A915KNI8_ROMCU
MDGDFTRMAKESGILAACTNLLINIRNLMHVCYDERVNAYALYPIPLRMDDNKSVLVLSQDDVEQNMKIQIDRPKPNFICQSYNNSLILTNLIMEEDSKDEFVLVFLDYFPQSSILDNRNEELFDSIIFDFKGQKENETAR